MCYDSNYDYGRALPTDYPNDRCAGCGREIDGQHDYDDLDECYCPDCLEEDDDE